MDSHLLFELTFVFYRICSAIINGERRLVESYRKFCLFYLPCEGWLRNLTQCLFITSVPTPLREGLLHFFPMMALFIIGEGFAWWSSWPLFVNSVLVIIGRDIGARRGSPLLYLMELLLQVINLELHGFIIILPVGDMASLSKAASTCMGGMYTAFSIFFPISFTFEIEEIILLMKVRKFRLMRTCLMWTWSCHI